MPFTFAVSEKEQILFVTGYGEITIQDCLDAVTERYKYQESGKSFHTFLDVSQVTYTPPIIQMRQIAEAIKRYKGVIVNRTAIVVKPEDQNKASVICMLVRPFGIRMEAYGDRKPALEYLKTGMSWTK